MSSSGSSPTRPAASSGGGELVSTGGNSRRSLSSSCGDSLLLIPLPISRLPSKKNRRPSHRMSGESNEGVRALLRVVRFVLVVGFVVFELVVELVVGRVDDVFVHPFLLVSSHV